MSDNNYKPLSEHEEWLGEQIVDAAFCVHKQLGPGLLEKIYEVCFCYELSKRNIPFARQVDVPIKYENVTFDEGLRIDVLVDTLVICELKSVDIINPVWNAQLLSHMKLTEKRLGYLINFNVEVIRDGIKRMIL